ncbi:FAD-dependent oxidoreductase [uncultured Clostridium sp.]|uniref:FAD-dependent oxidoreductase n=1 Tax=uncultured Clostridium sp. TaxID=59620 RepID=UPI002636C57B|nr:FAD-dependent oxidoreductase [uncultured Clostridium sp.]
MKVVVVGCTHAGTAAINGITSLYKDCEVTVYERNDNISFLSCGIALHVADVVKDPQGLFYSSPAKLAELGVQTKMQHEVTNIDIANKKLTVKNLLTGEEFEDSYDKLVLTPGSWPIVPKFEGLELENILLSKNYNHSQTIIEKAKTAKNIVVIGAGYIGVELAEAFEILGKNVTLIDAEERIMSKYLDEEFTSQAEEAFTSHGIKLATGELVQKFEGENGKVTKVVTNKGTHEGDLVILCIGFRPSTELVHGQLDTLPNGAIIIDEYMRTSNPDVMAAGDCCVVRYNPAKEERYIPLATNAVRMGTLVARNLVEPKLKYMGTQGTSGIKIYEHNIASTGMTETIAKATTKYNVASVTYKDNFRPEFMPTNAEALVKLVFDADTRRILGGQIISDYDLTELMNTLSVVIQNDMTVEELAMTDFFFQPHYNKPWGLLNAVALQAL